MRIVLKGNGRRIVLRQTGARGQTGPQGPQGIPGQDGVGLPTGGTSGQVPVKQSSTDFDIAWETPPAAPVTSVNGQTGVVVLDAGDVGADPSGSAAQALSDANDYTDTQLSSLTTDNVTEASNLYFTNARAITALTGQNISIFNNDAGYITEDDIPTAPVTSVNGEVGDVVLSGDDIESSNGSGVTISSELNNLDVAVNQRLQLSGGTMTGAINMGSNKITSLANGTDSGDAVNYGQLNSAISGVDTGVMSVTAGSGIDIDNTDPQNPVVSADIAWGTITGDLEDQTDLQGALDAKADTTELSLYALKAGDTFTGPVNNTMAVSGDSGTISVLSFTPTVSQSGTAGYSIIDANLTESSIGSGDSFLIRFRIGSSNRFFVTRTGAVSIYNTALMNGNRIAGLGNGVNGTDAINMNQLNQRFSAAARTAVNALDPGALTPSSTIEDIVDYLTALTNALQAT